MTATTQETDPAQAGEEKMENEQPSAGQQALREAGVTYQNPHYPEFEFRTTGTAWEREQPGV